MSASMIMLLVAEVLIQPINEQPSARPAWDPQQLNWMKPLDWNCKMRSSEGREFVIEGHFDKPNAFSRGQGAPTRSEENTSDLNYLSSITYYVFCLKKTHYTSTTTHFNP